LPSKKKKASFKFRKTTVKLADGTEHKVFLKKLDKPEFKNFQFIQEECKGNEDNSILKYMPRVYGQINRDGQDYMVMEDLEAKEGGPWQQVGDLKMTAGGQYDDDELTATGRKEKTVGVSFVLKTQSTFASDYLTVVENKAARTWNAIKSKITSKSPFQIDLKKELANIPKQERDKALIAKGKSFDIFFTHKKASFSSQLLETSSREGSQENYERFLITLLAKTAIQDVEAARKIAEMVKKTPSDILSFAPKVMAAQEMIISSHNFFWQIVVAA
jgi:hypothetical protein